jgi:hypothetical protein
MLCVRIKRRSGAYVSSRQDTDYARAGGGQELRSPVHDRRYGLPDTDVGMSRFEGYNTRLSPRVVEGPPHGFNDVYSGFEELWRIMARRRNLEAAGPRHRRGLSGREGVGV